MDQTLTLQSLTPFVALAAGTGGILVVLVAALIKKVFGLKSEAAIHTMVVVVNGAAAAAQYLLTSKNLPPEILGLNLSIMYTASQFVYRYSKYTAGFLGRVQATYSAGKASLATAAPATTVGAAPALESTTAAGSTDAPAETVSGQQFNN